MLHASTRKARLGASGSLARQRPRALLLWIIGIYMLAVVGAQTFVLFDSARSYREGAKDNLLWNLSQVIVEVQFAKTTVLGAFTEGQPTQSQRVAQITTATDIALSRLQVAITLYRSFYGPDAQVAGLLEVQSLLTQIAGIIKANPTLETRILLRLLDNYREAVRMSYNVVTGHLFGLLSFEQHQREGRSSLISYAMIGVWLSAGLLLIAVSQGLHSNRLFAEAVEKTKTAAQRLQRAFDASPYSVCLLDAHLNMLLHNNKCETFARITGEAEDGPKNLGNYLNPADRAMLFAAVQAELDRGKTPDETDSRPSRSFQIDMVGQSGPPIPVELIVARLSGNGAKTEFVVYIRDRSADVASVRDFRTARDRAVADASIKERFLSLIGHELRTPLQGVLAAVELISAKDSAERSDFLRSSAKQCAQSALTQIDNVLLQARSGRLNETEEPFSPKEIVESITQEFAGLAAENKNDLVLHVEAERPNIQVLGQATSFNLAVRNLLSNAIKYTQDGTVTARLRMTIVDQEVDITFSVADTGLGIADNHLPELFVEYIRVGQQGEAGPSGFGLGLPIAKASVERLGGTIEVKSTVGLGSVFGFSFRAPARNTPAPATFLQVKPEPDLPTPTASKNVLLVEDDFVNQTLLLALLQRLGHAAVAVPDGETALALSQERKFDHVLMDLSLPGMDGIAAATALLQTDLNRSCPITMLTARDTGEVEFLARQAGILQVIRKPVDMERLRLILADHPAPPATDRAGSLLAPDIDMTINLVGMAAMQVLVAATLTESANAIAALREYESSGSEMDRLIRSVHKAAGSAGIIGLSRLSQAWQDVETQLRDGTPLPVGTAGIMNWTFCDTRRDIEAITSDR